MSVTRAGVWKAACLLTNPVGKKRQSGVFTKVATDHGLWNTVNVRHYLLAVKPLHRRLNAIVIVTRSNGAQVRRSDVRKTGSYSITASSSYHGFLLAQLELGELMVFYAVSLCGYLKTTTLKRVLIKMCKRRRRFLERRNKMVS